MSGISFQRGSSKVGFEVVQLPNRVNPALVINRGANQDVVAYFTHPDNATRFEQLLDYVIEMQNCEYKAKMWTYYKFRVAEYKRSRRC